MVQQLESLDIAKEPVKTRKTRDKKTYATQKGIVKVKFPKSANKVKVFEGSALIHQLWVTMAEKGETPRELCDVIGITYSYLMLLAKGERSASGLSKENLRNVAAYLGVPTSQAALMSEFFRPVDFFLEATIQERIELVVKELKRDTLLGGFALKDDVWHSLPISAKLLIAVLFENGGKTKLLDAAKMVRVQPA